jgi:hypothetical protein
MLHVKNFCKNNYLDVSIKHSGGRGQTTQFATNAAVKQVFLDNVLLKNLAYQKVAYKRFEVARVHGEIVPALDN